MIRELYQGSRLPSPYPGHPLTRGLACLPEME